MTILNGEPIETPNISTAPSVTAKPVEAEDPRATLYGAASLIAAFILAPAGFVLGLITLSRAKRYGGGGNSLALWAVIVSLVIMLGTIALIVWFATGIAGLFTSIVDICNELGPGIHEYNGARYECNIG
jgi:hypothetical protein